MKCKTRHKSNFHKEMQGAEQMQLQSLLRESIKEIHDRKLFRLPRPFPSICDDREANEIRLFRQLAPSSWVFACTLEELVIEVFKRVHQRPPEPVAVEVKNHRAAKTNAGADDEATPMESKKAVDDLVCQLLRAMSVDCCMAA